METIKHIFTDEWRYWQRTKLGITVLLIGLVLTLAAVVVNTMNIQQAAFERKQLQETAEARFVDQPDRHPHRMVHYGHYVFRTPSQLSTVEPGVDAYTGTSIFLEGHRQNSAIFADQRQSSGMTRFSSLSPSFLLQILAPLFVIIVGFASVTREKEAGTLNIMITQGLSLSQLFVGKYLALFCGSLLFILPVGIASIFATLNGEATVITLGFFVGYCFYMAVWCGVVIGISSLFNKSSASFASSISMWVLLCILVPRIGSSTAAAIEPSQGKLEADFAVLEALRKLGDGHNAQDPAFAALKANLLAQYDADDVSELPVNFRGVVAQYSEQKLTDVLNRFAEARMDTELAQTQVSRWFGWLSPTVAIRTFSMAMAGTNIETHHRFLREAEILRFDFVQSLNKVHADHLDYNHDVNRYKNEDTATAAKVDASHWQVLSSFSFAPAPTMDRIQQSLSAATQLLFWVLLTVGFLVVAIRRVKP